MITRRQALAVGSPTLVMLLGSLAWNAWDHRGHLLDQAVRLFTTLRD